MLRPLLLSAVVLAVASSAYACGSNGDDDPTDTPAPPVTQAASPRSASPGDDVLDLSAELPLTTVLGASQGDYENDLPALAMGDVNGDGLQDLLVGARFGDGPDDSRRESGEAYIILGRAEMPATMDLALGAADVTVYGANGIGPASAQGDQLAFSGTLGDVNADGLDDIILGAPLAGRPNSRATSGATHVIFGRAGMPAVVDLAQAPADVTILGGSANSLFGDSVATGDVDGDGTNDLIIGSAFEPRPHDLDRPGQLGGAVFVYRGGPDIGGTHDVAQGQYDAVLYGIEEFEGGDETGDNVASGDLNDDGIADIVITAEAADGPQNDRSVAAEVYVVHGSRGLAGVIDLAAESPGVTVFGADDNDTTGFNIAAGDATGDGIDDLLVSLRGGDGPDNRTPEAGELHIFPGPSLPSVIDLADYADDDYIHGSDPADFLGNGIALADWDGDGALELIVGSPMGDGPADDTMSDRDTGEAYVIDARGISGPVAAGAAPRRLTVFGAGAEDALGQSVAAGDMNGDGRPELAVLAMRADGPDGTRPGIGAVYIISAP